MEQLLKKIITFRDKRNWKQFHTPRNLAESIVLEASEVLEVFQWKRNSKLSKKEVGEIQEELADLMIYIMIMAYSLNINLNEAIEAKLKINEKNYPVKKSKGKSTKYSKLK